MATAIFEPCKSRKRKPKLFGFHSFASPGSTSNLCGPFRDNIRLFLQECAEIADYGVAGMPTWSTLLVSESDNVVFPLYTIEESVQQSLRPFCDHCKCVGWSHHFVSKRRYHMIIPADDKWDKPLKGNSLELRTHLLHGMIHCNGFGHLLCINGLEENSNSLYGFDIMDLWDRLCTTLQTRKISVNDALQKISMEFRLLHGVAYGESWFGKWGYQFGRGRFGVTEHQYNRAINILSTLDLDKIIQDFKNTSQGGVIEIIIRCYREFSETQLVTISDLLQFMLAFKSRAKNAYSKPSSRKTHQHEPQTEGNPISIATFVSSLANIDCRWPQKRLEYAVKVIVTQLKYNKKSNHGEIAVSRKELRDAARQCIGDTGLIDFVLKSINCLVEGNQIVRRSINPSTNSVEFTVRDVVRKAEPSTESTALLASAAKIDSRWPLQRLEHAAKVVWNILKEHKAMISGRNGMSRQELRDMARQYVGDTGLIDFVLKSIDGSVVGNQIVRRLRNPSTNLIEFVIQDVDNRNGIENSAGLNVYEDVEFLYRNVLFGYPESDSVTLATRALLDSNHFVKEWRVADQESDQLMTLTCRVLPSFDELETELTRPLPPGELVMVPPWFTIGELKVVAQCALRDTYCVMERFVVRQIGGLRGIEDERVLSCAVASGADVWVRGCGLDLGTKLRYQGGASDRTVDCVCGARDKDEERMVVCDRCHAWQHTTCSNIEDDEPAPSIFLCTKCRC